jgi:hypothetical protein
VPKVRTIDPVLFADESAYRTCAMDKRLIARSKKPKGQKF